MIYFTDSARSARSWNLALISVKSTTSNKGQYLLAAGTAEDQLWNPGQYKNNQVHFIFDKIKSLQ
jgi:hypothetical protein